MMVIGLLLACRCHLLSVRFTPRWTRTRAAVRTVGSRGLCDQGRCDPAECLLFSFWLHVPLQRVQRKGIPSDCLWKALFGGHHTRVAIFAVLPLSHGVHAVQIDSSSQHLPQADASVEEGVQHLLSLCDDRGRSCEDEETGARVCVSSRPSRLQPREYVPQPRPHRSVDLPLREPEERVIRLLCQIGR